MSEPFLAHSEISNEIYIICGKKKYPVTEQVISAMKATGRLNDRPQGKHDRQTGEWIEYNATGKKQYMCSECSMKEKNPKIARYCYWCGAKMKGGAE